MFCPESSLSLLQVDVGGEKNVILISGGGKKKSKFLLCSLWRELKMASSAMQWTSPHGHRQEVSLRRNYTYLNVSLTKGSLTPLPAPL